MGITDLIPDTIPFHLYGLILGCAVVIAFQAASYKVKQHQITIASLEWYQWWLLLGGILGARAWHVLTDWQLYIDSPWQVFAVWQGGLSIIGAVVGAAIAGYLSVLLTKKQTVSFKMMLDLGAFSLPIGQAMGRVANWVNQELYGYPTSLPWGIFISPENRLPAWRSFTHFHPLFAYEMVVTASSAAVLWWLDTPRGKTYRPRWLTLGSGRWFAGYIGYYAACRFGLDFMRPDKAIWLGGLGSNQLVLMVVVFLSLGWLYRSVKTETARKTT